MVLLFREDGSFHVAGVGAFGLQAENIPSHSRFGSGSYQRVGDPGSLCDPSACPVHLHHHVPGCW